MIDKPQASRREFFRDATRTALLSAMAALSVVLVRRTRPLAGQRCVNRGLCNGCAVFAECGLPQALSAKLAKRELNP